MTWAIDPAHSQATFWNSITLGDSGLSRVYFVAFPVL
jgi:hypothetical protein